MTETAGRGRLEHRAFCILHFYPAVCRLSDLSGGNVMRLALALATGLILFGVAALRLSPEQTVASQSGRTPAGTSHSGKAFRFNKVKDGIYHAVGTGTLAVVGNSAV